MKNSIVLMLALFFLQSCQAAKESPTAPSETPAPAHQDTKNKIEKCKIKFTTGDSLKEISIKAAKMYEQCQLTEKEIKLAAGT